MSNPEVESLKSQLRKAKSLLFESLNYLDRDFSWEKSDMFEDRVREFLGEEYE
jgi:hypothetical protein